MKYAKHGQIKETAFIPEITRQLIHEFKFAVTCPCDHMQNDMCFG